MDTVVLKDGDRTIAFMTTNPQAVAAANGLVEMQLAEMHEVFGIRAVVLPDRPDLEADGG